MGGLNLNLPSVCFPALSIFIHTKIIRESSCFHLFYFFRCIEFTNWVRCFCCSTWESYTRQKWIPCRVCDAVGICSHSFWEWKTITTAITFISRIELKNFNFIFQWYALTAHVHTYTHTDTHCERIIFAQMNKFSVRWIAWWSKIHNETQIIISWAKFLIIRWKL